MEYFFNICGTSHFGLVVTTRVFLDGVVYASSEQFVTG